MLTLVRILSPWHPVMHIHKRGWGLVSQDRNNVGTLLSILGIPSADVPLCAAATLPAGSTHSSAELGSCTLAVCICRMTAVANSDFH